MGQQATATPGPSFSANKVDMMGKHQQQEASTNKELLLLPPQLRDLRILFCRNMSICSNPLDNNNEEGRTLPGARHPPFPRLAPASMVSHPVGTLRPPRRCPQKGRTERGLQGLSSLQRLVIWDCAKFFSSYSSSSLSSCFFFPNSLEFLHLRYVKVGMGTLQVVPLSNLCSLKQLFISDCGGLAGEGLLSLLSQGHLTQLEVIRMPNFFVDFELLSVPKQELPSHSSKLQELKIDDVAAVTTTPIHSLLFSSLTTLKIAFDNKVESFAEEQEALLFANSLGKITFELCSKLQNLPARLYRLPNLKILKIWGCKALQMLPRDSHPSSIQELEIRGCPEIQSLPKDCLPSSLQKLVIIDCPAIQSLPNVDDLPSPLRELNVRDSRSEELRSQCRKLIRIIPIVRTN